MRSRRGRQGVRASSVSSPDPDYNPGLSQILIELEGAFRGTRSTVAIPYNYEHSSIGATLPEPLRSCFQWLDEKEEANSYASSVTVSSEQTWVMSVNMADNNHDDDHRRRIEAQKQSSRAQQAALENI